MNASVSFFRAKMAPAALAAAIGLAFAMSAPAQAQYTYPGTVSSSARSAHISPARAGVNPAAPVQTGNQPCPAGDTENSQGTCMQGGGSPPSYGDPSTRSNSGNGDSGTGGSQSGYGYPAPRAVNGIHPIRAHTPVRANAPATGGYGNGNPSMQRGEACPPGSMCATPVRANGSGSVSDQASSAYGAGEAYGSASMTAQQANATQPVATGGKATISPVQAGAHGALNYGTSQSASSFRNTAAGNSSGPNMNPTGQQNSFTGPNGQKVNMGGTQSFTGPNGQKQTIGGGPDMNNLGGGYGHQKGTGMNMGGTVSYSNGSGSMTQTGSAPGMASGNGLNMNNGGVAGVSEGADGGNSKLKNYDDQRNPDGSPKATSSDSNSSGFHPIDAIENALTGKSGKSTPDAGSGSKSGVNNSADGMDPNKTYKVSNPNAVHVKKSGGEMPADMGPAYGPGEVVSGTGKVVQPGKPGGSDVGGGQGSDSGTSGGGTNKNNATGAYLAPSGQDVTKGPKPKEVGVLKTNYNGKLGVTDPQENGGH